MAKIDLEKVLERVDRDFVEVLQETLDELGAEVKVDRDKLFRIFRERLRRHFRRPVEVPDEYVEVKEK